VQIILKNILFLCPIFITVWNTNYSLHYKKAVVRRKEQNAATPPSKENGSLTNGHMERVSLSDEVMTPFLFILN
jgi:hypothetical protein